jgi:hypothetical protein
VFTLFDKQKFAETLKKALGDRTINQYSMHSGVSATYISKLLRGLVDKAPGVEVIRKLSDKAYNGVTYMDLMAAAGHIVKEYKTTIGISSSVTAYSIPKGVKDPIKYIEEHPESEIKNNDIVFDNDLNMLNKYYKQLPEDLRTVATNIIDNFTLLVFRDIQKQDKARLQIYNDIFKTLQEFKIKARDFAIKRNTLDLPSSLTEIMEIQAKYKGDIGLLLDKLVQTYLESNSDAKKAMDEMSSALEKHA